MRSGVGRRCGVVWWGEGGCDFFQLIEIPKKIHIVNIKICRDLYLGCFFAPPLGLKFTE